MPTYSDMTVLIWKVIFKVRMLVFFLMPDYFTVKADLMFLGAV